MGTMPGGDPVPERLLDLAPLAVLVIDASGVITWVGGRAEGMSGYRADELVGSNMLDHIDTTWNPVVIDAAANALVLAGRQRPMLYRLIRKDGTRFIAEITGNGQMDDPAIKGVVAYVRQWDQRFLLDMVIESLAAGDALTRTLRRLVRVMESETLEADGMVLLRASPIGVEADAAARYTVAVASTALPDELSSVEVTLGSPFGAPPDPAAASPPAGAGEPPPFVAALESGQPRWARVDQLAEPLRRAAADAGYQWCWSWPVRADGATEACLVIFRQADEEPDHACTLFIEYLVRITALVIERERASSLLRHAADHDELTGLANRAKCFAALQEALDGAVASRRTVGVLYIDLDDFKPVNDLYGHAAGDEVLREVARRLLHTVRRGDLVARLGGDEFAVVCPGLGSPEALDRLADRVTMAVHFPVEVPSAEAAVPVQVAASVGRATALAGTCSPDELVAAADAALYSAKAARKGDWRHIQGLERRGHR